MSIISFKTAIDEYNKRYTVKKSTIIPKENKINEKTEKHITNSYNSLNYKYMKLQKKYKSYKPQDVSNIVNEEAINKFISS